MKGEGCDESLIIHNISVHQHVAFFSFLMSLEILADLLIVLWRVGKRESLVSYLPFSEENCLSSVQFSCSVMSDFLRPHELQHARPSCPSPAPGVYPNSSPLSRWCHPTISFSVVPFFSCSQSFPASGSFPISQLFASGGQSIGVSASTSVLPMNTQDWSL